jgi:uncharacterized membrane protein YkoI
MKTSRRFTLLATALVAVAVPVYADRSHDDAKRLQESGDILPLERIIEEARIHYPGRIIETELERKKGRYVYEIEIVDEQGVVRQLKYDARDGTLIKLSEKDKTGNKIMEDHPDAAAGR